MTKTNLQKQGRNLIVHRATSTINISNSIVCTLSGKSPKDKNPERNKLYSVIIQLLLYYIYTICHIIIYKIVYI